MIAHTESSVLALLHRRFALATGAGNGPRYVYAEHVRSHAGFDATRTFDAVAVDLWQSAGHVIHAFEVKVSRSDWLRELADPSKSGMALNRCDTFSVVAPEGVVKPEELVAGWGWYVAQDGRLVCKRAPKRPAGPAHLRQRDVPRAFMVPLVRAAARTAAKYAFAAHRTVVVEDLEEPVLEVEEAAS